jgi:anti-anti-sigma regulatory factor
MMPELVLVQKHDMLIAQFTAEKILDDVVIVQIGEELLELADQANGKMLLDFQGVAFMSSSMIGHIVVLNKKCEAIKAEVNRRKRRGKGKNRRPGLTGVKKGVE